MRSKKKVFLFPDIAVSDPTRVCIDSNQVEVLGFGLYTFIRRLDNGEFGVSCAAVEKPGKKAIFYRHTCNDLAGEFANASTSETDSGIVLYFNETAFNALDAMDGAVRVKSGDWESEKMMFHSIGALHHLGVIVDLSGPVFSMTDNVDGWTMKLNEDFGTVGGLSESLEVIYRRMRFAFEFFGLEDEASVGSATPAGFCFGPLLKTLKRNPTFEGLKRLFPASGDNRSPLYLLNFQLTFVARALCVADVDDFGDVLGAVKLFQKNNGLPDGFCDLHTASRIAYQMKWNAVEPLPIFKMAGIKLDLCRDVEFPALQRIAKPLTHPLCEKVRVEINRSIAALPDPKEKIEWMNRKIDQTVKEYDAKCSELCQQVEAIEKTVMLMIQMTKDIMQESQSAASRVEAASRTLRGVYDAHNRIRGKFEILRDKLFIEQRNTRVILLIGILVSFLGALRVFWKQF